MFLINLFYTTQQIHKNLVRQSYNDYMIELNNNYNFKKNININKECISDIEYYDLNNKDQEEWIDRAIREHKLKKILVNNLLLYCKNYPNEKINKNQFISDYNVEHSYRLEQNIEEILLEL